MVRPRPMLRLWSAAARPNWYACGVTKMTATSPHRRASRRQRSKWSACVGRLGRQVARDQSEHVASAPTLSQLPVGSFLLALHDCIDEADGAVSFTLTGDALLDIVASGYLDVPDPSGRTGTPLLRRVLPYFADCRSADDWTQRADLLVETVQQRVLPYGGREPEDDDATRIERAVLNPTRMVPWADISDVDAERVRSTVVAVVRLLVEITAKERVVLGALPGPDPATSGPGPARPTA